MADKSLTVDGNWTTKTAPVAADRLPLIDSETNPNSLKDVELSNLHKALTQATDTQAGTVEFATDAETITGTSTALALTPANLQAMTASATRDGIVELATDAEAITGSDTARAVTPANLRAVLATLPRGTMFNLKLSVTVSSNDLVVALKTHAGTDPSATDPGYVKIGDTVRSVTAATSFTLADGTNWFGAGGASFAAKEVDYFAYVVWDSDSSIVAISAARIPWGNVVSDFSSTSTSEKYLVNHTNFTGTDGVEIIGRFAATLSAVGTSHLWTVPTYTAINLIQRPIYETRSLPYTPAFTGFSADPTVVALYTIKMRQCFFNINTTANGTSNANTFTVGLPITSSATSNDITKDVIQYTDNGTIGTAPGLASMPASSTVTQLFKDWGGATWTTSGNKGANFSTCYNL